jgi:hypothetical protein
MRLRAFFLVCGLLCLVALCGCGKGKTVKVSGVVTLDGKPVGGAMVEFIPVDPEKGKVASGITGSDGEFRLTTKNPNDGAIPGEYKVVITLDPRTEAPEGMGKYPGGGMSPDQMTKAFQGIVDKQRKEGGGGQPKKKATTIPAMYGDVKTTTLKATVPTDGKIELALRSQGG